MKSVVIYEEAKRLFIEGYSLDAIVELLKGNVARKTLFNWCKEHSWEDQRRKRITSTSDLQDDLIEIVRTAIRETKANPTPHNIYAIVKAVSAMKLFQGIQLEPEEEIKNTAIKEETIKQIERDILGIE